MADELFENPHLAVLYDAFDADRSDLEAYASIVDTYRARAVLDIGCGTGTFACRLAACGIEVIGLDPAEASLQVAQKKPWADRVRWIHADVSALPPVRVDLVTMTGNVAQVFLRDEEWLETLRAVRAVLRPGGLLVFETRNLQAQAWLEWNRERSYTRVEVPMADGVARWFEVTDVRLPFVSFRGTYVFERDGTIITSDSTLRFRSREEITGSLVSVGLSLDEVREAPDRPGREMVFLARRPATTPDQDARDGAGPDTGEDAR